MNPNIWNIVFTLCLSFVFHISLLFSPNGQHIVAASPVHPSAPWQNLVKRYVCFTSKENSHITGMCFKKLWPFVLPRLHYLSELFDINHCTKLKRNFMGCFSTKIYTHITGMFLKEFWPLICSIKILVQAISQEPLNEFQWNFMGCLTTKRTRVYYRHVETSLYFRGNCPHPLNG